MSYEWPLVENEEEYIVSHLNELNSVSVCISATTFSEILGVSRPNLSLAEEKLISTFIGMLSDIARDEEILRVSDKANQFGRDFRDETVKLVALYFSAKKEAIHLLGDHHGIIETLQRKVENYLQNTFVAFKSDDKNVMFASELAAEYLIVLDVNKYGNPQLPAVDIYFHHPMVDLAAAFALVIHFIKWVRDTL